MVINKIFYVSKMTVTWIIVINMHGAIKYYEVANLKHENA